MLAIILISTLLFINEASKCDECELKKYIYSILGASLLAGTSLVGIISLLTGFLQITWLPIWTIGTGSLLCFISTKQKTLNTERIIHAIKNEFNKLKDISKSNKLAYLFLSVFVGLIIASSVGPINHPDAANYHVGYPFQIYSQNKLFVDGGLHQGLLGLADFAYLAFYQENLSWLIKTSQILFFIPLIAYLINQKTNLLLVLAFATTPLLLQWTTIGKPIFLAESIIAVSYLTWNSNKSSKSSFLLIVCLILGSCFKISSLIIAIPILAHLAFFYSFKFKKEQLHLILRCNIVLISICLVSVVTILVTRFYFTSNPLYPLFSSYFTPNDWQKLKFELMLKNYNGVGEPFPISLFIPTSLNFIYSNIGAGLSIALLLSTLNKNNAINLSSKLFVGLFQLILILVIGQKRGDYFASPAIILLCGSSMNSDLNSISEALSKVLFKVFKYIALPIQIAISLIGLLVSTSHNVWAIFNYEKMMNHTAYGYQLTKAIEKHSKGQISLNFLLRNTMLYRQDHNFIGKDKILLCIGNKVNKNNKLIECLKKYKIRVVALSNSDRLKLESKNLECIQKEIKIPARNPFNSSKFVSYICKFKAFAN